MKDYLN